MIIPVNIFLPKIYKSFMVGPTQLNLPRRLTYDDQIFVVTG